MTSVQVRPAVAADHDELYGVCLLTGDGGRDGTAVFADRTLLGDVYVGAYLQLCPEFALVADDGSRAAGYALGVLDTREFEDRCDVEWWPAVRRRHQLSPSDVPDVGTATQAELLELLHRPGALRHPELPGYPSHLHIDLLEHLRGSGLGSRMMEQLLGLLGAAGSVGVHLGVDAANTGAQRFYRRLGFVDLQTDDGVLYQGMRLR